MLGSISATYPTKRRGLSSILENLQLPSNDLVPIFLSILQHKFFSVFFLLELARFDRSNDQKPLVKKTRHNNLLSMYVLLKRDRQITI